MNAWSGALRLLKKRRQSARGDQTENRRREIQSGETAREIVLRRLAGHAVAGDTTYPSYSHPQTGLGDLRQAFKRVLDSVGGECYLSADYAAARELVTASGILSSPGQVSSYVKEIAPGNFDAEAKSDVRECRDVRLTMVRGELAVAENGAVWVDGSLLRHRGLLFLTERLMLVLDGRTIVPDMESAYKRIDFAQMSSGYFISGPSKTADIEQCLVIGAHGAESLVVVIIG
jgi:L-lactate dehydrogenase complex protein LldG